LQLFLQLSIVGTLLIPQRPDASCETCVPGSEELQRWSLLLHALLLYPSTLLLPSRSCSNAPRGALHWHAAALLKHCGPSPGLLRAGELLLPARTPSVLIRVWNPVELSSRPCCGIGEACAPALHARLLPLSPETIQLVAWETHACPSLEMSCAARSRLLVSTSAR
jgi:hypothetical protein